MNSYIEVYLSKYLCWLSKKLKHTIGLDSSSGEMEKSWDKRNFAGCINHELLIAKLHAYGFIKNALRYLRKRIQSVKIDSSFSSWSKLLSGVPLV